jgi:Dullard-like phosphatase family protein
MELILDIDIEKQTRLKNKINFNFPKPKKKGIKKRIALFDLDETLVHCTGDIRIKTDKYQHVIEINLPGKQAVKVGINLRPYWKQTLNLIKRNYFIVIYTASHQAYADAVLDFMDPKKKYFKYRLYRNNCSLIDVEGAKFYVKDLDILNEHYDLKDIVIIDNSVLSFAYHLHNGIPIVPYYDEDKDGSLYVVGLYLIHIFEENDLREANKTQINLDSFLEEAKKQKEENENIIDEESPSEEEEEKSPNPETKAKETKLRDEKNNNIETNKISGINTISRKRSFIPNTLVNPRRQSHDLTQRKLISQSKLINMYFEVNDESSKTIQNNINEAIEENKGDDNNNSNSISQDINQKDKATVMITEEGEVDCKSDPGLFNNQNNSNNNSDNDSSDEEIAVLKRGYTIIDEERNEKNKIKGKLKFIRSNFFNKFKIK